MARVHKAGALKLALAALVLAGCQAPEVAAPPPVATIAADVPQTKQPFKNDPDDFQFVIIGDRTGGHRAGVFEHAMRQIDWLQPEFVIGVGDNIEGYSEDPAELKRQWDELDGMVNSLDMRFFYVPGNHDISNLTQRDLWRQRLGRDYYHFVYKNVLFIALSTEDPPNSGGKKELRDKVDKVKIGRAIKALQEDPDMKGEIFAKEPELAYIARAFRDADRPTFSAEQLAYVKQALADNANVRWTVLLMHKPAWRYDSPEFREIEALLANRPYTMFAGHLHTYDHTVRNGRDYVQMGTTGGMFNGEHGGAMDHVMWVTMTDQGPEMANIRLDGLLDRRGPKAPARPTQER